MSFWERTRNTKAEPRGDSLRDFGPARLMRSLLLGAALTAIALPSLANAPETAPRPKWRSAPAQSFDAEPGVVNAGGVMSLSPLLGGAAKAVLKAGPQDPSLPSDPGAEGQAALAAPGKSPTPEAKSGAAAPSASAGAVIADGPATGGGGAATDVGGTAAVGSAALRPMPGVLPGAPEGLSRSLRPKWRPETLRPAPSEPATTEIAAASPLALSVSPRPKFRPKNLAKTKRSEREAKVEQASLRIAPPDPGPKIEPKATKGALCGISGLSGTKLTPIASGACGVKDPVRLTALHGVALSAPATMECASARALSTWVQNSLLPTVGNTGGGVKRIDVAASYACRPRNNQKGQKLSEHGRGKAIDITAIQLKNGSSLSVLHHWNDRKAGPLLKAMHRGACGPFGTVLGPNANAFHRDHFHFDTASYRNGAYCK